MLITSTKNFTLRKYRELVNRTKNQYDCMGFDVLDSSFTSKTFAILRHDIDMSPLQAHAMAKIEADLGVKATYTVLLTGQFYSPFEDNNRRLLKEIAEMGHHIGLHFDASWHGIENEDQLNSAICWETDVLDRLLNLKTRMFSFHNTTPFTMSCRSNQYAGLRNAYAGYLQEHVEYTSDSNGYWIYRSWDELLTENPERIQVLTHPEWWNAEDSEPAQKVCSHIANRATKTWRDYRLLLSSGNRTNRTGLSVNPYDLADLFDEDGERLMMLWLEGRSVEAFVELFCRFERQARRLIRKYLRSTLRISARDVNVMLGDYRLSLDPIRALSVVSDRSVKELTGLNLSSLRKVRSQRNVLVHGHESVSIEKLSISFDQLVRAVGILASWGEQSSLRTTGTRKLTTKGMPVVRRDLQDLSRWLRSNHERLGLTIESVSKFESRHSVCESVSRNKK